MLVQKFGIVRLNRHKCVQIHDVWRSDELHMIRFGKAVCDDLGREAAARPVGRGGCTPLGSWILLAGGSHQVL